MTYLNATSWHQAQQRQLYNITNLNAQQTMIVTIAISFSHNFLNKTFLQKMQVTNNLEIPCDHLPCQGFKSCLGISVPRNLNPINLELFKCTYVPFNVLFALKRVWDRRFSYLLVIPMATVCYSGRQQLIAYLKSNKTATPLEAAKLETKGSNPGTLTTRSLCSMMSSWRWRLAFRLVISSSKFAISTAIFSRMPSSSSSWSRSA